MKSKASELLRKEIERSRESYAQLERATGVDHHSISRFVKGVSSIRLDNAEALFDYFGFVLRKAKKKVRS